jgi:hypothetical protein
MMDIYDFCVQESLATNVSGVAVVARHAAIVIANASNPVYRIPSGSLSGSVALTLSLVTTAPYNLQTVSLTTGRLRYNPSLSTSVDAAWEPTDMTVSIADASAPLDCNASSSVEPCEATFDVTISFANDALYEVCRDVST